MPHYTYRREDGTTFEIRQSFSEHALTVDPVSGQKVRRVVHNAGVIFKGSGFYKSDNRNAAKSGTPVAKSNGDGDSAKTSETTASTEAAKGTETAKPTESSRSTPAPSAAAD